MGATTGCQTVYGPQLGLFATPPIPVSPYFQSALENKAYEHERYERVPILGPITSGGPPVALDPPSDDEIMRALEKAHATEGGVPYLYTAQRDNVRIIVEPIADYVDPPRVYPLIGPAQLHHAHYKCIINYSETKHVGWPIPYTVNDEEAQEVIYIDHNHFHMVGNVDTGPGAEI
ncbi:MAG: hypothetical protein JW818_13635 [Pirellulales bacterium]|nr:hypothetical protein [Pirellulales bacterium]